MVAAIFCVTIVLTGILPIILFAIRNVPAEPGDYSFIRNGAAGNLTTKWWMTSENITENGMYGQKGFL